MAPPSYFLRGFNNTYAQNWKEEYVKTRLSLSYLFQNFNSGNIYSDASLSLSVI